MTKGKGGQTRGACPESYRRAQTLPAFSPVSVARLGHVTKPGRPRGGVTGPRQPSRHLIVDSQIRRMRSQAKGLGQSRIRVALPTLCAVFIPDVRSAQTSTHILKSQENNGPLIEKNAQGSGMVFLPFLHFPSMMGHSLHLCTQPCSELLILRRSQHLFDF